VWHLPHVIWYTYRGVSQLASHAPKTLDRASIPHVQSPRLHCECTASLCSLCGNTDLCANLLWGKELTHAPRAWWRVLEVYAPIAHTPASGRSVLTASLPSAPYGHTRHRLRSSSALAHPHVLPCIFRRARRGSGGSRKVEKDVRVCSPPLQPPKGVARSQCVYALAPKLHLSPASRRPEASPPILWWLVRPLTARKHLRIGRSHALALPARCARAFAQSSTHR